MYKGKRILALIPARGGSKGLPNKNILPFCGKPLIAWSIGQAKESRFIDTVVVSTDSPGIARVAQKFGAEVPFLRPRKISGASASTIDAVLHAVGDLEEKGRSFDIVVLLQPTSPLRKGDDVDRALRLFFEKETSVISVCEAEHSPLWSAALPADRSMAGFVRRAVTNKPRQALPVFYRINGAVYVASVASLRKDRAFLTGKTRAYVMPRGRSVDIVTGLDFEFAAFIKTN